MNVANICLCLSMYVCMTWGINDMIMCCSDPRERMIEVKRSSDTFFKYSRLFILITRLWEFLEFCFEILFLNLGND